MLRVRSKLGSAAIGAIMLLTVVGCVDDAGSGTSQESTLAPLVQTTFATISPATSTTLATSVTATQATGQAASASVTSLPSSPGSTEVPATPDTDSTDGPAATADSASDGGPTYTVVAKDTVFGIARRYGITSQTLADLNNWSDGDKHLIVPGQTIKLPAGATPSATTPTTAVASGGASTTTSTSVAAGPGGTYVVVAGDYLAGIAVKNGTTVQAIVTVNGWPDGDKHLIVPGQTIKLPAKNG